MDETDTRGPLRPGLLAVLLIAAALVSAGFVALGAWQLQRLAWKQDLIERIERQLAAEPVPAPGPGAWPRLSRAEDEYRRVLVRGEFVHERETLVRASTALGSGHWVLTPLRSEEGFWVLVNRGFVPPDRRERASRAADEPRGMQQVTGLLRLPEPGGSLLQDNDPAADRWYSRDVAAIAAARGLGAAQPGPVAPYFIDEAAGARDAGAWPRPGLTVLRFSNKHLGYALTWFALAAMVAGATGWLLHEERRLRRSAGDPTHGHARD